MQNLLLFAIRTPAIDLEKALGNYNPSLPYILKQERLTPESFGLILLRALKKEKEDMGINYEKLKRENRL